MALGAVVRRVAPAIGAVVPPRAGSLAQRADADDGRDRDCGRRRSLGFGVVVLQSARASLPSRPGCRFRCAAIAMFVVGVLDDRLQLSPLAKLVASLIIGAFLVFSLARTSRTAALPWTHTLVATMWFAGVCHAINLLDNMDGLAAGVALIAAAFLAWLLGARARARRSSLLLVALCRRAARVPVLEPPAGAAVHGRLRQPVHRRDACRRVAGAGLRDARVAFVSPAVLVVLILVVPLFDTAFVLVLRRLAGRSATRAAPITCRTGWCRSVSPSAAPSGSCICSGIIGGVRRLGDCDAGGIEPMLPVAALFGVLVTLVGIYLARVPAYNAAGLHRARRSRRSRRCSRT